jgi:hypothetical protein
MARDFKGEQSQQASHPTRPVPLRVSLPTERDPLTQRETDQPTINERPTGETSGPLSLEPLFNLKYPIRDYTPTRRDNDSPSLKPIREG